ncbi:MAG: phage tail tape measure protein [Firmicutes bacterium]|nr:phage tail tape measure protein [Bacillota bacterium]
MDGLGNLITKGAAAVAGALVAIGTASLKTGMDFEREMKNLQAIMGITGEAAEIEMAQISEGIRKVAVDSGSSVIEIAANAKMLAEAGGDVNLMMAQLTHGVNLANATQTDMATTLDFLGSTMKTFGIEADDTQSVVDSFALVTSLANVELSQLGESYVNAGGSAAQAGLSIDDVNAVLITFANAGLKGGAAGTALNSVLKNLRTPTNTAAKELDRLGIALYEANGESRDMFDIMSDLEGALSNMTDEQRSRSEAIIFDSVAQKGWNMLMDEGIDAIVELSSELADSVNAFDGMGQAAGMAAIQSQSLSGMLNSLKAQFTEMGLLIYDQMEKPLKTALSGVLASMNELRESMVSGGLSDAIAKIGEGFALLVEVLVKLAVMALPTILGLLGGFADILGRVALAIVGVIEAIGDKFMSPEMADNIQKINEAFDRLKAALPEGDLIQLIADAFTILLSALIDIIVTVIPPILDFFTWIVDNFNTIAGLVIAVATGFAAFQIVTTIIPLIAGLSGAFAGFQLILAGWSSTIAMAGGILPALGGAIAALVSPIALVIGAIAALVAGFIYFYNTNEDFRNKVNEIWDNIKEFIVNAVIVIKDTIINIADSIKDAWVNMMSFLADIGVIDLIIDTWNNLKESIASIINSIKDIFTGLISHMSDSGAFEGLLNAFTSIWNAIKDFFATVIPAISELFTEHFSAIAEFITLVFTGIKNFLGSIFSVILTIIGVSLFGIFAFVTDIFSGIAAFLETHGETIKTILIVAWELAWATIQPILNFISEGIKLVGDMVKNTVDMISGILSGDWAKAWEGAKGILEATFNAIDLIFQTFKQIAINTFNVFKDDLIQLWETLKQTVTNKATELVTGVVEKFNSIKSDAIQAWENLKTSVINIVNELVSSITEFFNDLPYLIGYAIGVAAGLVVAGIVIMAEAFIDFITNDVPQFIDGIVEWFSQLPDRINEWLINTINNITEFFVNIVTMAESETQRIIESIITWFSQLPDRISEWLTNAANIINEFFSNLSTVAASESQRIIDSIIEWFSQLPTRISECLQNTVQRFIEFFANMGATASSESQNIITNIINAFTNLPSLLADMGRNAIQGLVNGIQERAGAAIAAVRDIASGIADGFRSVMNMRSPSRVMQEIGEFVGEGLEIGIENSAKNIIDSTEDIGNNIIKNLQDTSEETEIIGKSFLSNFGDGLTNTSDSIKSIVNDISSALGKEFMENLIDNMSDAFENVKNIINQQWDNVKSISKSAIDELNTNLKDTLKSIQDNWRSIWESINKSFTETSNSIKNIANNIVNTVKDAFNNKLQYLQSIDLYSIGANMMQGLMNGIMSMANNIMNSVQNIANNIINTMQSILQIRSPSRVAMTIGKDFSLGIAIGLEKEAGQIEDSINNITDRMSDIDFTDMFAKGKINMPNMTLPPDKFAQIMASGTQASTSTSIDRGITINFNNYAPINSELDIEMIMQRIGNRVRDEERSRGLN